MGELDGYTFFAVLGSLTPTVFSRYTGSDISVVVRDALMQPVRKVLSATHFKPIVVPDASNAKWTPCSPGDPDAVEKAWTEVESDELLEPPLRLNDFVRAVNSVRPTVTEEDIKKHDQWTNDSGIALRTFWCLVHELLP